MCTAYSIACRSWLVRTSSTCRFNDVRELKKARANYGFAEISKRRRPKLSADRNNNSTWGRGPGTSFWITGQVSVERNVLLDVFEPGETMDRLLSARSGARWLDRGDHRGTVRWIGSCVHRRYSLSSSSKRWVCPWDAASFQPDGYWFWGHRFNSVSATLFHSAPILGAVTYLDILLRQDITAKKEKIHSSTCLYFNC